MNHPDLTVSNFIEKLHWSTRGEGLTVERTIIHVEKSQENDRVVPMAWFRNLNKCYFINSLLHSLYLDHDITFYF